jgi:hypothetical protein
MSRRIHCALLVLAGLLAAGRPARADDLERALEARLRGAWAIATVEVYSDCAGTYTNNHVTAGGVASRGDRRFAPGELAKVDKLSLKRSGLDLFLTLAAPVLRPRLEGPFQLFDERECKVQLMFELDRRLVASEDTAGVLAAVDAVLETAPSLDAAQGAERWNRRERESYPEDYELTLARYEAWKAEQANLAVAARSEQALADALRDLERVHRDPPYADGFAAGVEAMRAWAETDCASLVIASFSSAEQGPPKERGPDRAWTLGFHDGQELAFNLRLVDRLRGCFVPVPPVPAGVHP